MLYIVIQKILNKKWLFLCLLIGCVLVVSLVSSISLYSYGILQRMLTKDLEKLQTDEGIFPGTYLAEMEVHGLLDNYYRYCGEIDQRLIEETGLPILEKVSRLTAEFMYFSREPIRSSKNSKTTYFQLESLSEMKNHINLAAGRMPSVEPIDGIYEAIVTESAFKNLGLLLDTVYYFNNIAEDFKTPAMFKVTGVFNIEESRDIYWYKKLSNYDKSIFIDYELFKKYFLDKNVSILSKAEIFYGLDYHRINLDNVEEISKVLESHQKYFTSAYVRLKTPMLPRIENYFEREKHLRATLWVLMAPVLFVLALYISMVSHLILKSEENEIAVLKSRGSSKFQVFKIYLFENIIICIISIILGPLLAFLICNFIGSSNGFMEFVQRSSLPLTFDRTTVFYILSSVMAFLIFMLFPSIAYSKTSIVQYKQKKASDISVPFWRKYFLDVVVLLISGYGLYQYNKQQKVLGLTALKGTDLEIDPLLFFISTLFILGVGMIFLRVYPIIIRLIFWAGKEIWSPVFYISLTRVGRLPGREQFIMLFIILAVALGIFNANEAATLNRNVEDKILYENGGDVVLMAYWPDNQPDIIVVNPMDQSMETGRQTKSKEPVKYYEPPFGEFEKLEGVESAAKVFIKENAAVRTINKYAADIRLMGIDPYEFGKTAWFRDDLLKPHWYAYLNLMSSAQNAMLLSGNFNTEYGVEKGEPITVSWGEEHYIEGIVYEFVDYWPSFNPQLQSDNQKKPYLVLANLSYIHGMLPTEPYQVWIKKKPDAKDSVILDDIIEKNLKLEKLEFSDQKIMEKKNDPLLQGTNGALTLGFIITMLIATIGFLIYWILSIKERTLQFGIFRAMGLTKKKVSGIIILEQITISFAAIVMGIIAGGLASDIFVPLLQLVYSSAEQVPPLRVVANAEDYIKVYIIVGSMLLLGFLVLSRLISRIKVDQALKLGED